MQCYGVTFKLKTQIPEPFLYYNQISTFFKNIDVSFAKTMCDPPDPEPRPDPERAAVGVGDNLRDAVGVPGDDGGRPGTKLN